MGLWLVVVLTGYIQLTSDAYLQLRHAYGVLAPIGHVIELMSVVRSGIGPLLSVEPANCGGS